MTEPRTKIYFASKLGFCSGVAGALHILERTIEEYGAPIYVYHKIVHNERVITDMEQKGAVFIDDLSHMADMSRPLVLSAHGSSKSLVLECERRGIKYIDAACPFVLQNHRFVRERLEMGHSVIVIGSDAEHDEILGLMGQSESSIFFVKSVSDVSALTIKPGSKVCYVSQTTLALESVREIIAAIKTKFPDVASPPLRSVCHATSERQVAARELVAKYGLSYFVVIGSLSSANTKSLAKTIEAAGCANVFIVSSADDIKPGMFAGVEKLGITAGASTPQELIEEVVVKIGG